MDVLVVHEAAANAVKRARAGDGPTLIEAKTYRYMGHSRGDPGKYRKEEELSAWRERDPIQSFRQLLADGGADPATLDTIDEQVTQAVEEAVQFAMTAPDPDPVGAAAPVYAEALNPS